MSCFLRDVLRRRSSTGLTSSFPAYAVHMLATEPKYERTGAGSALVRWGMAKADAEKRPLYLDATEGTRHRTAVVIAWMLC